jgi:hypothetical protein
MEQLAPLMSDSGVEWKLNQILYADKTALLTDENFKF